MNNKSKQQVAINYPVTKETGLGDSFNRMNLVIVALYVLVQLIPRFDSVDVMGGQWLYLAVLNFFTSIYLLLNKRFIPNTILKNTFLILYLAFVVISGLSFFVTFNAIESLVTYSRLLISVIAFLNLLSIFYHNKNILKALCILIGLLVLFQSLAVIIAFISSYGINTNLDEIIENIKGNSGHKNILAASIAIKIPFVIYLIHSLKGYWKLLSLFNLFVCCIALFFINARSSYLAIFSEIVIYFIIVAVIYYKGSKKNNLLRNPALVTGVFIFSIVVSQFILKSIAEKTSHNFTGSISSRIESIGFSEVGSSKRTLLWNSAFDFIKNHPITGGGYGNWKIHSIPYEKGFQPGFAIMKHAHNDFLEVAADTGIPGALVYVALFLCLGIYSLKIITSKKITLENKMICGVAVMALTGYFIDAFFNFPLERPNIQVLLAIIMAVIMCVYFNNRVVESNKFGINKIVLWMQILISLLTVYVSYETFKSMEVQYNVSDVWFDNNKPEWYESEQYQLPFNAEVINARFPSIPNISEFGMPISCMKAKFLFDEKKYDKVIEVLDADKNANSNLYYDEYLRGLVAMKHSQFDTAFKYAKYAFYNRPSNMNYYYFIQELAFKRRDSVEMERAFNEILKWNYSHQIYSFHAQNYFKITQNPLAALKIVDDGLTKYPSDSSMLFEKSFLEGIAHYNKNEFAEAIKFFMDDLKYKDDVPSIQNIVYSYFNLGMYQEALLFSNLIVGKIDTKGRLEFMRGICYQKTGRKKEACSELIKAKSLGYQVDSALLTGCK